MTIELITFTAALAALAAWLGYRAGYKRAHLHMALLYYRLGVRVIDLTARTITFSDGSTHTERRP